MKLSRIFFLTMSFFVLFLTLLPTGKKSFFAFSTIPAWRQEIQNIEKQIQELTEMKRGYEARALRHEDQAQRLQFRQNEQLTVRKHWQLADENREIAKRIQLDIDQLEARKQAILREHEVRP
jgi:hypothetical protein